MLSKILMVDLSSTDYNIMPVIILRSKSHNNYLWDKTGIVCLYVIHNFKNTMRLYQGS